MIVNLFNITGFNWLPHLINRQHHVALTHEEENLLARFTSNLKEFNREQLDEIINEFKDLRQEERERLANLERKAMSLLGYTGIAATISFSVVAFSIGSVPICFILLYSLVGISLLLSTLFASRATRVGEYRFTVPEITNLWDFVNKSSDNVWRNQAYDILYSYFLNRHLINRKASFVIAGQDWFRNAIIFLLILSLVAIPTNLASNQIVITPNQLPTIMATSIPTSNLTNTPAPIMTTTQPTQRVTPQRSLTP